MFEDVIKLTRRHFGKLGNLVTGKKHPVQVKTRFSASLLEVEDVNFHYNSAVFLPDHDTEGHKTGSEIQDAIRGLAVLKACYEQLERCPEQSVLIVGHTDRSGSASYNQELSELRARNVQAAIDGNAAAWATICDEKHRVEDYQRILAWITRELEWECDPGKVDNKLGPKTTGATSAFHVRYNAEYGKSLSETGVVTTDTWMAFFDVYMTVLGRLMNVDEKGLEAARARVHYVQCGAIGCGEDYPITPDRKGNYTSPVDRRVEVLFFEPDEEPLLDCDAPSGACTELFSKKMYTLAPISTRIEKTRFEGSVRFLGTDYVPQSDRYRCAFELVDASDAAVPKDATIKPGSYRILIHDNHALRDAETNLLGGAGDAGSRPASYRTNDWLRDVRPAVGLRVVIRMEHEGKQTRLPENRFFVRWELIDDAEDAAPLAQSMNPARLQTFVQSFTQTFRRDPSDAGKKDEDNALVPFGGVRPAGAATPARSVLFKTPFDPRLPIGLDAVGAQGRVPVVPAEESGAPVGHADVVFFPPPVGGDNYRFRLRLTDAYGNPVQVENEADWTVGTFTLWRKISIDLLVKTDNVSTDYINWDLVKKAYRSGFVEVEGPNTVHAISEGDWKKTLKSYFINVVGVKPAVVAKDDVYDYSRYFLPDLPGADSQWASRHGRALSRVFLNQAYKALGRTDPHKDDAQNDAPGLFVFLCKRLHTSSGLLGVYLGQREFFMVTVGDGTVTFAHEMGHALFLRHSVIRFNRTHDVTEDIVNDNWLDHDQADALVCVMAYENDYFGSDGKTVRKSNPVSWHFCGVCALTLRHFDRVQMSADARYRKLIYREFLPIKLADSSYKALPAGGPSMKKGDALDFKSLARAEPLKNNSGGPFRKDLTSMRVARWVSSEPGIADFVSVKRKVSGRTLTFMGRLRGKGKGTGSVKVHFEVDGHKSETIDVSVTD